jgi:hypothetical protein
MLMDFIDNGKEKRLEIYSKVLTELKEILNFFETNYMYQFYASSILIIYDGEEIENKVSVKLIDFAHVQKSKTFDYEKSLLEKENIKNDNKEVINLRQKDDSYIIGLKNLIQMLENIINKKEIKSDDRVIELSNSNLILDSISKNVDNIVNNISKEKGYDISENKNYKVKY